MEVGRVTDYQLAADAATAVGRGNVLNIGLNQDGELGRGTVWAYRADSSHGGKTGLIDSVLKYTLKDNKIVARFQVGGEALRADILAALRMATFRVIAFADGEADRAYSQIHPHNIEYGAANVAPRLRHIPVSQMTCQLDGRGTYDQFNLEV